MQLSPLTPKDKSLLATYFKKKPHSLSGYSLGNILLWRPLYEVLLGFVNKKVCLFFRDKIGCFMAIPPMGGLDMKTVGACFEFMEDTNHNTDLSRIESIEEGELAFFKKNKFRIFEKSKDYIVNTRSMADLKGDKFKHKRNLVNNFSKKYDFIFRDYASRDEDKVLALYKRLADSRKGLTRDPVYLGMLDDSFKVLTEELKYFDKLGMAGKVVECDGDIRAFTSGFEISRDLFCINFEIADLSFKGIAQFIFSEFAKTLVKYREINIMDDSGIENIRNTKLSYHPCRSAVSYTALLK